MEPNNYSNEVIKELITRRSCKSYLDTPVPEGIEILNSVGLDDSYAGVGNMALGYAKAQPDNTVPRRKGRVYRI